MAKGGDGLDVHVDVSVSRTERLGGMVGCCAVYGWHGGARPERLGGWQNILMEERRVLPKEPRWATLELVWAQVWEPAARELSGDFPRVAEWSNAKKKP